MDPYYGYTLLKPEDYETIDPEMPTEGTHPYMTDVGLSSPLVFHPEYNIECTHRLYGGQPIPNTAIPPDTTPATADLYSCFASPGSNYLPATPYNAFGPGQDDRFGLPNPLSQPELDTSSIQSHISQPTGEAIDQRFDGKMSAARGHNDAGNEYVPILWNETELCVDRLVCTGRDGHCDVMPEIKANTEKGFFLRDGDYVTYRRNYFAVMVSFLIREARNGSLNGPVYVIHEGHQSHVKAFGMRISAAVDQPNGKVIELVQHTPKRDNGPKTKVEIVRVAPSVQNSYGPGVPYQDITRYHHIMPQLPYQQDMAGSLSAGIPYTSQSSASASTTAHLALPGQNNSHTFDRVQFKNATANNGKRRASQQYFLLKVELYADVRSGPNDAPVWLLVAQKVSTKLIVRGRSPSHYAQEGVRRASGDNGGPSAGAGNGPGTGIGAGAGYGTGAGAGNTARYPAHFLAASFGGPQGQFGYSTPSGGTLPKWETQYDLSLLSSRMLPNGDCLSPSGQLTPFDGGDMIGAVMGTHIGQHSGDRHGAYHTTRISNPLLWSQDRVKRIENGSHRDTHRDRHRRPSVAHSIAYNTPSPIYSPGGASTDWSCDEKNVYFSPSLH